LEIQIEIISDKDIKAWSFLNSFRQLRDAVMAVDGSATETADQAYGEKVELKAKYPVQSNPDKSHMAENDFNRHARLSGWMYRLRKRLENLNLCELEEDKLAILREKQALVANKFAALIKAKSFPSINVAALVLPTLGPLEGESEPYNRIWCLLEILKYQSTTSRLKHTFECNSYLDSVSIDPVHTPEFMRAVNITADDHKETQGGDNMRYPPKIFLLLWKLKKNTPEAQQILEELDVIDEIPNFQKSKVDPRVLTGSEFRDAVKMQYSLLDIKGRKFQFEFMRLKYLHGDEETRVDMFTDWHEVILPLLTEKSPITIEFGVRPLGERELEWETMGFRSTLKDII
jgi:hypothetical protein